MRFFGRCVYNVSMVVMFVWILLVMLVSFGGYIVVDVIYNQNCMFIDNGIILQVYCEVCFGLNFLDVC